MHTSKIRSFLRITTIFNLYYHRNERTYIHVYEPCNHIRYLYPDQS